MLASLRRGLNTWVARLFFLILVACFGAWGVGDEIRGLVSNFINGGDVASVATVGSRKIELPEAQDLYRQQLAQVSQMFGGRIEPTLEIKRGVAARTIEGLVSEAALDQFVRDQGLTVSDEAVRQAVWEIPQFQGDDGKFSRPVFEARIRAANFTEQRFLAVVRSSLAKRQVLEAIGVALTPPESESRELFAFQREKRVAEAVEFPLASVPAPPAPTPAQLQRWYDNHPESYQTVEMRRIKAVVLAPETVAKDITVTDDDIKAAYEQRRAEFDKPEKRSAQIVQVGDEAKARALAEQWRAGADWATMQAAAQQAGGSAIELTDATQIEFPARELGAAVFKDTLDQVADPVKSPLAWHVVKVTKVTQGANRPLDQVREELRARVLADKAVDLIYERANKIEEALAAGTGLDDLPGDLGLAAVTGTLDAQGNTEAGQPAPIPGPEELRPALIQAAFAMKKGDPVHLVQAPNAANGAQSFYAVQVEDIQPPVARPFADVAEQVKTDWTHDAIRHEAEEAAAKVFAAVKGGQSMADAATVAGATLRRLPAVGRSEPVDGVPAQLITPLFSLKKGEPTMLETADGFIVAAPAEIIDADPDKDPVGYGQMRDAFASQMTKDSQEAFGTAIRDRLHPRINARAIDTLAQAN